MTPHAPSAPVGPARPDARLPLPAALLVGLGALLAMAAHLAITLVRPGLAFFTFDSAEYALAGRQLAETGRLATPFVHSSALSVLHGPPFPLLVGHPLVPLLDALLFRVGGARPDLTLLPSIAAFVITCMLAATLAMRLGGSRIAAFAAACAFALSPWALRLGGEGLSEMPFTMLVTAALVLLWDLPERPRPFRLGLLLGLAHLARPVLVPMLPVWIAGIVLAAPAGTRGRNLLGALAGFLPAAASLALYKWVEIGSPLADVSGYLLLVGLAPEFVVQRLNRMVPALSPWPYLRQHPWALAHKAWGNLGPEAYTMLVRIGKPLGALAAFRFVTPGARREGAFRVTVAGGIALLLLLSAVTVPDARMAFPFVPALAAMGCDELVRLLAGRGFPRAATALGCAALVAFVSVVPLLRDWRDARAGNDGWRRSYREAEWLSLTRELAPLLPDSGVVACDAAPWIAWYDRRPATLTPLEPAMLDTMRRHIPVTAVVVTNEWVIRQPGDEVWQRLFDGTEDLPGWRRAGRAHGGRLQAQVFLPAPAHRESSGDPPLRRRSSPASGRLNSSRMRLNPSPRTSGATAAP